jgi:hypothetical protein
MPAAIVETPAKGSAINAPVGADVRNAASVRTPFQAVGNRLKFLEDFYDAVKAWMLGGTITPDGGVTIDGDLTFPTGGSAFFATGSTLVFAGGNVLGGGLFAAGQTGDANRKLRLITSGSGDVQVNTAAHNTVVVSGISGAMTLELTTPTYVGAHVTIVNESASQFVTFKPQGGVTFGSNLKFASGLFWCVDLVWDGTAWRQMGYTPYNP